MYDDDNKETYIINIFLPRHCLTFCPTRMRMAAYNNSPSPLCLCEMLFNFLESFTLELAGKTFY